MSEMMGTMNFVNQVSVQQQKVNRNQTNGSWKNEASGKQSFYDTLQQSVTSQLAQESKGEFENIEENKAPIMNVDIEKLLELFSQLPFGDGLLNTSMLEGKINSEILEQIPLPFQE